MIDKLKPFQQTPTNIKECQMEADEILEEDLDEEAVEPLVVIPCSKGLEEIALHKEKDGDWGDGILPPDSAARRPARSKERSQETLTSIIERGATSTTEEA